MMPARPRVLDLTAARLRRMPPNPNTMSTFYDLMSVIITAMQHPPREAARAYRAIARHYGGLDLELIQAVVVATDALITHFIRCGQEAKR
jgi:hypothetical protein